MTIRELLIEGIHQLQSPCATAFIDTPVLDASLLLREVLNLSREDLILRENEKVNQEHRESFSRLITRRKNGECIAYVLGRKEFRGLNFIVNPNVLVPRPDTEILVETALEYIDSMVSQEKNLTLLDLCTGSGVIAISLKNERPFLEVTASDISSEALEITRLNSTQILSHRGTGAQFVHSDLFERIAAKFHIIVSNPPYVSSVEIAALAPELRREPRLALDGGEDGLDLIKKIVNKAPDHLFSDGYLILEAAPQQMPAIRSLFERQRFTNIRIHKDLAGRDRVISAKLNKV